MDDVYEELPPPPDDHEDQGASARGGGVPAHSASRGGVGGQRFNLRAVEGEDEKDGEEDGGGEGDSQEGVTISKEMILKGVSKADSRRGLNESMETYLERLTHLTLNEKNIGRIDMLRMTPGLRVLYLYDNVIQRMNAFDALTKLTHLYLQNNLIERITGLERLSTLSKLYLDGNRISYVDGLERCVHLEELHVSGQRLGPGEELRFNPSCMEAIGTTLMVLNAAGSQVRDPKPLAELLALRRLNLEKCHVASIRDIEPVLMHCRHLQNLEVRGCPFAKNPKHREHVTLLSDSLVTLNDRDIKPNERTFLIQLQTRRTQKRAAQQQQQQQQQQHLDTIANLGAGTVDHGFDGFGSARGSPDSSSFRAVSVSPSHPGQLTLGQLTSQLTQPSVNSPPPGPAGGPGGAVSELTLQMPTGAFGVGGISGARSPRSGGGFKAGATSPRRAEGGGTHGVHHGQAGVGGGGGMGRVGGPGFGSSVAQRGGNYNNTIGGSNVGGYGSGGDGAGGAKMSIGGFARRHNQENVNHRYGGHAAVDTTSRFEVPDE